MNLRETQRLMWRAITWPTGVADFLAQADPATREAFAATFAGSEAMSALARVDVYAESYYWRLEDVLREQFRVTAWLAGDVAFHDLCTDFVLHRPSNRPDVRRFAAGFVAYLAGHALARRIVGIEDVAAVEWAAVEAIDARDVPAWRDDDLAAVPLPAWPDLRLCLRPGAQVIACRLPYARLWADRAGERPSPAEAPAPADPPGSVLVWRKGLEVFHRTLATDEAIALACVVAEPTFGTLVETAARDAAAEPGTVVAWLRRWLRDELLAAPAAGAVGAPGCRDVADAAD